MPLRFAELQLTKEAIEVLKGSGIADIEDLAEASVTDIQGTFIAAAQEGRYPEKFPSLVKIAAWVEEARSLAQKQPKERLCRDLDSIPTAVIKPATAKKKTYAGSGAQATVRKMDLRPDRHRPRKQAAERSEASGERVTVTPRGEPEERPGVVQELNPDHERALHKRRPSPTLRKSEATRSEEEAAAVEEAKADSGGATGLEHGAPPSAESPSAEPIASPTADTGEQESPAPFRSFDDYKQGRVRVKPLDRHSLRIGEDTMRSTESEQESFEEEQVYKKRMPIWRLRGVRHPDGMKVYLGAAITFLAVFLTFAVAIGAAVFPIYLEDFRLQFAGLFALTLVFWGMYIVTAIGMRCRVCSCHLFYSRRCLKNSKAHRILGGLPMLAQTIHILFWRWFRCMYCGTAIRLKADKDDH